MPYITIDSNDMWSLNAFGSFFELGKLWICRSCASEKPCIAGGLDKGQPACIAGCMRVKPEWKEIK